MSKVVLTNCCSKQLCKKRWFETTTPRVQRSRASHFSLMELEGSVVVYCTASTQEDLLFWSRVTVTDIFKQCIPLMSHRLQSDVGRKIHAENDGGKHFFPHSLHNQLCLFFIFFQVIYGSFLMKSQSNDSFVCP